MAVGAAGNCGPQSECDPKNFGEGQITSQPPPTLSLPSHPNPSHPVDILSVQNHALSARPTDSAEADTRCEKWDIDKMTKKDSAAEEALWNSRMFTAPRLLENPEVWNLEGGDLSSPDVGRLGLPAG